MSWLTGGSLKILRSSLAFALLCTAIGCDGALVPPPCTSAAQAIFGSRCTYITQSGGEVGVIIVEADAGCSVEADAGACAVCVRTACCAEASACPSDADAGGCAPLDQCASESCATECAGMP